MVALIYGQIRFDAAFRPAGAAGGPLGHSPDHPDRVVARRDEILFTKALAGSWCRCSLPSRAVLFRVALFSSVEAFFTSWNSALELRCRSSTPGDDSLIRGALFGPPELIFASRRGKSPPRSPRLLGEEFLHCREHKSAPRTRFSTSRYRWGGFGAVHRHVEARIGAEEATGHSRSR